MRVTTLCFYLLSFSLALISIICKYTLVDKDYIQFYFYILKGDSIMQKIIVPAAKCIPGMITASPIIDLKTGTTIMAANQELTPSNINNILNFVHTDIWVYLDSFEKVWGLSQETIERYLKYSNALISVVKGLDSGEAHSVNNFESLCNNLTTDFKSNHSLLGCTNLLQQIDYNTYNHSINVAFISLLICRWCNLDESITNCAIQAGLLHDIGLLNLSFNPFETKEPWTDEQRCEYQKHSIYGYNLVSKFKDLDPMISEAILAHHEHCDGTGFPVRISAPYINQLAKVLALAETYETLISKDHIFNVLKALLVDHITEFDPKLLLTFCTYIANYYIGTFVILNNGLIGEVVFINQNCVYRPIVKANDQFINLYEDPSIEIVSIQ